MRIILWTGGRSQRHTPRPLSAALWTIGNWGAVYSACLPCWSRRSCQCRMCRKCILGQFLYGSENRVGTACAKCRMKREVIHQMSGDILYAWAATEINAHKRTDDFAVLITIQLASHTKGWVYNRWELGVKLLHYWKYSSKRSEFLRFNLYFCHVISEFCLFIFATLR